jgi:hypothetical protein
MYREEYLVDKRSNLGKANQSDLYARNLVFDAFEEYDAWKIARGYYDLGDVVLRLLQEDWKECFASGKFLL